MKLKLLLTIIFIYSCSVYGDISINITPSKTSGAAPLAVFFDATGTTSTDTTRPFHELDYTWDFGDPGSRNFINEKNKNSAKGGISGHCYEIPGTYTVTLTVKNHLGEIETEQISITVEDPDIVFAGTNTICFSNTGNFAGAPSGALLVTTSSELSEILPYVAAGRRLLLRRGETWTASTSIAINNQGPGIISSFGTGANPLIENNQNVSVIGLSHRYPNFGNWTFSELNFTSSTSYPDSSLIGAGGTANNVLIHKIQSTGFHTTIFLGNSILDYNNNNGCPGHTLHDNISVIECDLSDVKGRVGRILTLAASRFLCLGNILYGAEQSHLTRFMFLQKAVINSNDFQNVSANKHLIKMHAPNFSDPLNIGYQEYTEEVILSNNYFQSEEGDWLITLGPQNDQSDERLRDIIVEKNIFMASSIKSQIPVNIFTSDITLRNNIFNLTNNFEDYCIGIGPQYHAPDNIQVYNNTAVDFGSNNFNFVYYTDSTNSSFHNNLIYAPNASNTSLITGNSTDYIASHNLIEIDPHLINTPPITTEDYALQSTSPAIDQGIQSAYVYDDYLGNPRNALLDVGAFEYISFIPTITNILNEIRLMKIGSRTCDDVKLMVRDYME